MTEPETPGPLGIFGGTFDPVHFGHLRLAEEARDKLGLDQVVWLPAGQPPLRDEPRSPAGDRVAMVRLAIAGNPAFVLDTGEADAAAPSYTVTTLERLRARHGERPLVLLLGADAFARLEGWHRWRELFKLAHIAVATRPGHPLKVGAGGTAVSQSTALRPSNGPAPGRHSASEAGTALDSEFSARQGAAADLAAAAAGRVVPFAIQALDISATALRGYLAAGASPRYLAPDAVLDYIGQHQLYRPRPH